MSTTAIATIESQAITVMGWNNEQIDIIKEQLCPGISDSELRHFAMVCQRTGLDAFAKQIYAIMRNVNENVDGKWIKHKKMTIQTSIDGFRLIAARTGAMAGIDDVEYDTETAKTPLWARVTVYRMVQGQRCPWIAKARWDEYVQTDKEGKATGRWGAMPYLMIGKCAEALALRKAFPAELSGLYTHDEMMQADNEPIPVAPNRRHTTTATASTANDKPHAPINIVAAVADNPSCAEKIAAILADLNVSDVMLRKFMAVNSLPTNRGELYDVLQSPPTQVRLWAMVQGIHNDTVDLCMESHYHTDEWYIMLDDIHMDPENMTLNLMELQNAASQIEA